MDRLPTMLEVERAAILRRCDALDFNLKLVAASLALSLKTLYNKLHEYEQDGWVRHFTMGRWDFVLASDSKI